MKTLLAWCHFGIGTEHELGHRTFEDTVAFVEQWHRSADGCIRAAMGPHSLYMDPPEVLRRFVEEARRVGVGLHFHLSESSEQLETSLAAHVSCRTQREAKPVAHRLTGKGEGRGSRQPTIPP